MYERVEDIVRLALLLQGARSGLGLEEIQAEFAVSRRTAERMRDAVLRTFPQIEEVPTGEKQKRWRMPQGVVSQTIAFEAAELGELALAAQRLRADGLNERAVVIESVRAKIGALMPKANFTRVEPDLEILLEAEGLAMRPGPRPVIAVGLLDSIRSALLGSQTLRLRYRRRISGRATTIELDPHGMLFGKRHYLVAFAAGTQARQPKLYALANISDIELTTAHFQRRPEFNLKAYAANSFGVFQENPQEVVWRFTPDAAADALEHHFHPTEQKDQQDDGSVIVRFRAGGMQEMAWHLFTWGASVEVLAPPALKASYNDLLVAAQNRQMPS